MTYPRAAANWIRWALLCGLVLLLQSELAGCDPQTAQEKDSRETILRDAQTTEVRGERPSGIELPKENPASPDERVPKEQSTPDESTPKPKRPNILLIIADDYGTDVSLAYHDDDGDGQPDNKRTYAPTPTLDGLCKGGVRFTQAWATPLCSSTRSTILTGRYGFRTGIGQAIPRNGGISPKEPTIPKILDLQPLLGFAHANIGKWHLGTSTELQGDNAPNAMGWSHYAGSLSGELPDFSDWTKITNGQSSTVKEYATTVNVDDAIAWLGQRDKSKPWFLWLAFNAPHNPLHLPPSGLHTATGLTGARPHIRANGPAYYRAVVQAMDTEIGRLFKWLKEQKMYDDTLIVFLGDNGTQQVAVEPPYDSMRSKGSLYQNGIHVPLCVAGAGVKDGGRTSDALVHSVDLFATLLQAAGVNTKSQLPAGFKYDSVSFLPLLEDANASFPRKWNYSERFATGQEGKGTQAIRDERYKLLRTYDSNGQHKDAFYDLQQDALEAKDLLANGPSLEASQKAAYDRLVQQLDTLLKSR